MPCIFCQRAVEGDDIALLQQLVQRNVGDPAVLCREQVIGDHVHPETAADIDEDPADLAGADHADGFAMEIESGQPVQGEVELAGPVIRLMNPPHGSEQQRDGMLGNRVGGISRDMDDVDLSEGGRQVHVIVTRRAQGDQPDAVFMQPVDYGGVHRIVHEHADSVAALCQIHGILVQFGFEILEPEIIQAAVLFKRRFVIGFCIEECHFDHCAVLQVKYGLTGL